MRTAVCKLRSVSPYSQSRAFQSPKSRDETHDDYENRCWRERCHTNSQGFIVIPPMCFKLSIAEAAKYKSEQIKGKGKATYTKHFEAGLMVVEGITLPEKVDTVYGERLFVPADGKRGGGKRVYKTFPRIEEWSGEVSFIVMDDLIDEDVFERHLRDAGQFIGIGRFRPRNGGFYGRFAVDEVVWHKMR